MNRQEIKGKWRQLRGQAKQKWGQLTDDDLDQIDGKRDVLIGRVQERYGKTLATAEKEVDSWMESID